MNKPSVLLVLLACLLMQGCISGGVRSHNQALGQYDQGALQTWLVADKTTKAEILSRLGPPDEPADFTSSQTWRYNWTEQSRVVVLPVPPVIAGTERMLILNFNEHQRLASYSFDEGRAKLQKGDNPKGIF